MDATLMGALIGLIGVAIGIGGSVITSAIQFRRESDARRLEYERTRCEELCQTLQIFSTEFAIALAEGSSKTLKNPSPEASDLQLGHEIAIAKINVGIILFVPALMPKLKMLTVAYTEWIPLWSTFRVIAWEHKDEDLVQAYSAVAKKTLEIRTICNDLQFGVIEHIRERYTLKIR